MVGEKAVQRGGPWFDSQFGCEGYSQGRSAREVESISPIRMGNDGIEVDVCQS